MLTKFCPRLARHVRFRSPELWSRPSFSGEKLVPNKVETVGNDASFLLKSKHAQEVGLKPKTVYR